MTTGFSRLSLRRGRRAAVLSESQISTSAVASPHDQVAEFHLTPDIFLRDHPPPYDMNGSVRPLVSPLVPVMLCRNGSSSGVAHSGAIDSSGPIVSQKSRHTKTVLKLFRKFRCRKRGLVIKDCVGPSATVPETEDITYVFGSTTMSGEDFLREISTNRTREETSELPSYDASEREKGRKGSILSRMFLYIKR